jgi:two-component system chemotaxis sensor kinase CheA
MAKYLGLFVSEANEHLQRLSEGLVRLERAALAGPERAELLDDMFRHAHSVKGMAGAMGLEGIAATAHRAEDLLGVLRRRQSPAEPEAVDLLLAATDALSSMVEQASAGASPEADAALADRLARAVAAVKEGLPLGAGRPAAPPPAAEAEAPALPAPGGLRSFTVQVSVSAGCPVPAVRGFLVLKKLNGLGAVARSTPSVEDLRAGRIPSRRLEVVLDSAETPQALERALSQISDLESVTIRALEEAPPPPAPSREPAAQAEASRTVRVRAELLDYFLDTVGELILAAARLREVGRSLPEPHRQAHEEGVDRLQGIVKDLHGKVMSVRMTPIATLVERLPRVARDLARKMGKQVEVVVTGAEIEIDRAILDELSDPLVHVLRNAVDHGLEPPHLRQLAGKPAAGRITVAARRERDRVILEVSDDGKGMDPARIRAAAVARGVIGEEEALSLPDRDALQLACLPGVSTSDVVTDVSGRGVGLDAVKRVVESVGGALEIDSTPAVGTRFTLRLPLTVAVQSVLLVRVGDEVLGLPIAKVHGAAEVELARLERSQGGPLLGYGGGHVPVHDLGRLLGLPPGAPGPRRSVVVAEAEGGRVGLAVDALIGQEEAVLKPLGQPLSLVPGLSAVTVLGNGRPVFILDVSRLLAA